MADPVSPPSVFMGARPVDEVVYMRTKSNMRSNILMGTLLKMLTVEIRYILVPMSKSPHLSVSCKWLN